MKKNSTTNFILFFLLFFVHQATAQVVLDTATIKTRTVSCSSSTSFTDDNLNSGLYFDGKARKDTVVICPNASSRQVKISFSAFDVASGDALTVFDGDITKNAGASSQTASGFGVSRAFGGWVAANCDPAVNPTGCLSFEFSTNGDNGKGNGWEASITCESSGVTVQCPSNISVTDDCNSLDGMVTVTIPKPTFSTCGGSANAMVSISSSCNLITGGTVVADGGTLGTFTIPLGTHSITATSTADNSKSCTYYVYADQPSITCNDNVTSSIGFGCKATLRVDDVLENPCVGSGTSYRISVNLGSKGGKKTATIDGSSFSTLNSDFLELAASDFNCGSEYAVEVTRIVSFTSCGGPSSIEKSCTGRVRFVDNEAPSITLTAPTLTTCGNLTDAQVKKNLSINVFDNCDVKDTLVSIGAFPTNFCASNLSVPITITAVDFCGNSKTETFNVAIVRPTNFYRPKDTVLTCGSGYGPAIAGYPLLDTDGDGKGDLPIIDNTCNFISIYTDQEVTATNSRTIKIFRTWQIKDWCNQAIPVTLQAQTIELKDTGKPTINCPAGNQKGTKDNPHLITASQSNCTGSINFVAPTADDDCGGTATVALDVVVDLNDKTTLNNTANLPIGSYYGVYFARDATGNRSDTCKIYFDVRDSNAPQANCVSGLNVALVNGVATLKVEDIDAGSNDNCGSLTKEIRKEGGNWGQTVSLTCTEIQADGKIYLRVTDSNGGQNTCWVQITGKDNSVPNCADLTNQTIACEDYHSDAFGTSTDSNNNKAFDDNEWLPLTGNLEATYNQAFGNPDCSNNAGCGTGVVEQQYQVVVANCGETKIKRRYRATNGNNVSDWKEQLIIMTIKQDFSVTFAGDWQGNCGDNFPQAAVNISTGGCSVLAWTHSDKRFDGASDACYYIERTYTVTNWCHYVAGEAPVTISRIEDEHSFSNGITVTSETLADVGVFQYIKILKVIDTNAPTIIVQNTDECISGTTCNAQKTFSATATDCSDNNGLSYRYELLDEAGNLLQDGQGAQFTTTVQAKQYAVKWTVNDNCGNSASKTENYTFKDCKKPSPVCRSGVASVVDNNEKALIWATDLNQKSMDNCSAEDKLEFRVYHPILSDDITKPQAGDAANTVLALPKSIELTCDYLGNQAVELYVVDEAGNWDFCVASVFIQDVSGVCGNAVIDSSQVARVTGGIISTNNIPISGVSVTAKGTALYEQTVTTDDIGLFELNLPKGIGYVISFEKADKLANGLSTFDIILVSKHILGIQTFEKYWQHLAADINQSGSVTAFDMVIMRQVILGIENSTINNENPWRFMPVGSTSDEGISTNEATLTESILIPNLTKDLTEVDYTAIKLGDLNASVVIDDNLMQAEDRNAKQPLLFTLKNRFIKKGETIVLPIALKELPSLQGLQFGLKYAGLRLQSIENGTGQQQHILQKNLSELWISWDKYSTQNTIQNKLYTLRFQAEKTGYLSDFLQLAEGLETEAISEQDAVQPIALHFEHNAPTSAFKLYQNTPNPFRNSTTIGFDIVKKSAVTLTIFDLQGRTLKQINATYNSGYHELEIDKTDLPTSGVLWYQLTTSEGVMARKMVIVE